MKKLMHFPIAVLVACGGGADDSPEDSGTLAAWLVSQNTLQMTYGVLGHPTFAENSIQQRVFQASQMDIIVFDTTDGSETCRLTFANLSYQAAGSIDEKERVEYSGDVTDTCGFGLVDVPMSEVAATYRESASGEPNMLALWAPAEGPDEEMPGLDSEPGGMATPYGACPEAEQDANGLCPIQCWIDWDTYDQTGSCRAAGL